MVTLLCRQIQDIGGRIAMLVTFQCEQSIINILSRLPTSKRCQLQLVTIIGCLQHPSSI